MTSSMQTLKFGIEIETVGVGRSTLARAIQSVLPGSTYGMDQVQMADGRIWKVVPDASLSGSSNGEIVSPILEYGDIEMLQSVVRAVRRAGAEADSSCGIHVHVDGRSFDARGITNLVKMVHKQERLIEHALGVSAARLSRYCRPIDATFIARLEARRPRTLEDVSEAWYGHRNAYPTRYDQSRYHGLNLNSLFFRKTIEFRYFNGTLHAGKVKAYIQFALAIAARAKTAKGASSKRRAFNVATAKYDFRVFLLQLGLIGEEFKTARHHLIGELAGSAAWKGERRDRRAPEAPAASDAPEASEAADAPAEGSEEGYDAAAQ